MQTQKILCSALFLTAIVAAHGATISGPTTSGGSGNTYGTSLSATDQANPLGFDVFGDLSLFSESSVPFTATYTITRDLTLSAGVYQTYIGVAGSATDYGALNATLMVSTELDLQGSSVAVAGSYVDSSGTYTRTTPQGEGSFDIAGQQPGAVNSSDFVVTTDGTYTLTQTIYATLADLDGSSSGGITSAGIMFDFTEPLSTITPSSAPEPATFAFLGIGAGLIAYRCVRRRRRVTVPSKSV